MKEYSQQATAKIMDIFKSELRQAVEIVQEEIFKRKHSTTTSTKSFV